MPDEPSIKILVCYHKPTHIFKNSILEPIHLGRAEYRKSGAEASVLDDMLGDDDGENISELNGKFCEMTALYWAWRNYEALGNPDYFGLMHYRRLLNFTSLHQKGAMYVDSPDDINPGSINPEIMREVITQHDMCVKAPINIWKIMADGSRKSSTVLGQYLVAHNDKYIIDAFKMAVEKYPDFKEDAQAYLRSPEHYLCNIAVMKKNIFFNYVKWMFSILLPMERLIAYNRQGQDIRCISYLSERLTGLYVTHLKRIGQLNIRPIPSINIDCC